jgi:hypothetical protein
MAEQRDPPIFTQPTFAPISYPPHVDRPAPNRGRTSRASYTNRPKFQQVRWASSQSGSGAAGRVQVDIAEPSLFRIWNLDTSLSPTNRCHMDFFWRSADDPGPSPVSFSGLAFIKKRAAFTGPFVYLPSAGRFNLYAQHTSTLAATIFVEAEIQMGVSSWEYDSLVHARPSHFTDTSNVVIAALGTEQIVSGSVFAMARTLRVVNSGANAAVLQFGPNVDIPLAVGQTIFFEEEEMGRDKVTATSAAGTTIQYVATYY